MLDYMNGKPLRYRISDWSQLPEVQSNNSTQVKIAVSEITNDVLTGTRIQVVHELFGVLFSCVINAKGDMVSELDTNIVFELTPEQILAELEKWGFIISYVQPLSLPDNQIAYLQNIKELGFDKIRVLLVQDYPNGLEEPHWYVVVFNAKQNPYWLNSDYSPRREEFLKAQDNGSAINITGILNAKKWSWSWLVGKVLNIDDILSNRVLPLPQAPTDDDTADISNQFSDGVVLSPSEHADGSVCCCG